MALYERVTNPRSTRGCLILRIPSICAQKAAIPINSPELGHTGLEPGQRNQIFWKDREQKVFMYASIHETHSGYEKDRTVDASGAISRRPYGPDERRSELRVHEPCMDPHLRRDKFLGARYPRMIDTEKNKATRVKSKEIKHHKPQRIATFFRW